MFEVLKAVTNEPGAIALPRHDNGRFMPGIVYGRNQGHYQEWFCDKVIDWGMQGMVPLQWCSHLNISKERLAIWMDKHPEFGDACRVGREHAKAYWLEFGINNMTNRDLRSTTYTWWMERNFPEDFRPIEKQGWLVNETERKMKAEKEREAEAAGEIIEDAEIIAEDGVRNVKLMSEEEIERELAKLSGFEEARDGA
ncbi:MAG: hypothetical protein AAGE80_05460 [Pseudomonadota bacterium]